MTEEISKLAMKMCEILDNKKGEDIMLINVAEQTIVADCMIIVTGKSNALCKALCDDLDQKMEQIGVRLIRKDGYNEGRWIAMDFGGIIVHIFRDEERTFYHLEKLWSNSDNTVIYQSGGVG